MKGLAASNVVITWHRSEGEGDALEEANVRERRRVRQLHFPNSATGFSLILPQHWSGNILAQDGDRIARHRRTGVALPHVVGTVRGVVRQYGALVLLRRRERRKVPARAVDGAKVHASEMIVGATVRFVTLQDVRRSERSGAFDLNLQVTGVGVAQAMNLQLHRCNLEVQVGRIIDKE